MSGRLASRWTRSVAKTVSLLGCTGFEMASTTDVRSQDPDAGSTKLNGCWMRFRRKTTHKEVVQTKMTSRAVAIRRTKTDRHHSAAHSCGLESHNRVKAQRAGPSKSRSEIHLSQCKSRRHALPPKVEKHLYTISQTSGCVKRMTMELDTHQKCVTNLAATVVCHLTRVRCDRWR